MVKNEIHARLSSEMMEKIKQLTVAKSFPTISHTCRWLLEIGIAVTNNEFERHRSNDNNILSDTANTLPTIETENLIDW
ncbi:MULTISPECIES: hypothetical protein [unclassified Microcoleus]|uniref:hypothetical protein n=1 Tax=unclassified Microcoleus TaxID=2642155 RepID=UPI002FD08C6A